MHITTQQEKQILDLFKKWTSEKLIKIEMLPKSGSNREYYRIWSQTKTAIGAYNEDRKENIAFLEFSKHFKSKNLNVPEIYAENLDQNIYLQEDLGDETLFSFLSHARIDDDFSDELVAIYKNVIKEMPKFQINGSEGLDYSKSYPRYSFDKQSMMWDLHYFKYYFLKLANILFDEQELENDYHKLSDYLLEADSEYFLYRDFQSRNIMIKDSKPYFIDYQGGRKGALQYDLASLLYDGKAAIPQPIRIELLDFYIEETSKYIPLNAEKFKQYYHGFVFIRIMQAMGAYGFRGFYERKLHFLKSIPFAINNLEWLLENAKMPIEVPTLMKALKAVTKSAKLKELGADLEKLTVHINSFSYKKGIPIDETGNGGGFVFDCRSLPNPGKFDAYKRLTGMDKPVIEFLDNEPEMQDYLSDIFSIADKSIQKYMKRKFTNLMVNFGCTGGQHRSVYSAERLKKYLEGKYNLTIKLRHREQENLFS